MRVWVGLIVLVAGVVVALLHFQTPPEPAGIEQIVAGLNEEGLSTSAIAVGGAGGGKGSTSGDGRSELSSWERRSIVVASRDVTDAAGRMAIQAGPSDETLSGVELVRALQMELQRVGCYSASIDGVWGPKSKRAMSAFTDRVNASLPVEEPDGILLRMVRAYDGEACGACRSGETRDGDGKCVPATVMAHEELRADPNRDRRSVEPLPGRMAVGGPLEAETSAPITRYTAEVPQTQSSSRPARRTQKVVERNSPPPAYRATRRRKHWTETIFDQISHR